jgi:predicted ferric reductase
MTTETVERKPVPSVDYESSLTIQSVLVFLLAVVLGLVAASVVLPRFVPGIAASFTGPAPKGYWFLSRGSAFVAMGLLWLSMMLGVGITNKMAHVWPGAPTAFAIHEYVSLLGLVFAGFHALILLGDQYSKYQLVQLLTPFGSVQYRPTWVALGQLGIYVWLLLSATFYVRKAIGQKTWRLIHYLSFLCYLGALVHGLMSGTDTGVSWAQGFYWGTGAGFLFLLIYRILTRRSSAARAKPVRNPAVQETPARNDP